MSTQAVDPNATYEAVQAYYSDRARSSTDCCAEDCCGGDNAVSLYEGVDLTSVPEDAAGVSLGCGNPTAIAALREGEVVVDLGSGGGIDVFLAAQQVGPTGFVYGVDMTDDMLDLARRNAQKAGVTNVEFRKGHIEDLPLADNSVDVMISNCVINLSPDKGQTLHEAFRVLRSGGRVAVSDVVIDGDLSDLPVSEEQVRTALSWAGCIAGALTIDQFKQILADAGFQDIEIEVRNRYAAEMFEHAEGLALAPEVLEQLTGRFTSSTIRAVKP